MRTEARASFASTISGTDLIVGARQLVNERLQVAREQLPVGIETAMGPISTGLGEIFLWTVEAKDGALKDDGTPYTPTDLRVIQDWIIKPQLRNVPGVAEINTIGGFAKEYQIAPDPKRLAAYKLTLNDLVTALERNNANVGAGYIERSGEQLLIRAPGQLASIEDIASIVITSSDGTPISMNTVPSTTSRPFSVAAPVRISRPISTWATLRTRIGVPSELVMTILAMSSMDANCPGARISSCSPLRSM